MLSSENMVKLSKGSPSTVLDAFCTLLQDKLVYTAGERDMICMHHEFGIERVNGKRVKERRVNR